MLVFLITHDVRRIIRRYFNSCIDFPGTCKNLALGATSFNSPWIDLFPSISINLLVQLYNTITLKVIDVCITLNFDLSSFIEMFLFVIAASTFLYKFYDLFTIIKISYFDSNFCIDFRTYIV